MARDYARLKAILANSKFQTENNALYQSVLGLISAVQELDAEIFADIELLESQISGVRQVFIVEYDTSSVPISYELSEYVTLSRGMVIFKDIGGNASVNNITLIGTVEGVVDPVINTDFGFYKVYLGTTDGIFHTW